MQPAGYEMIDLLDDDEMPYEVSCPDDGETEYGTQHATVLQLAADDAYLAA